MNHYVNIMNSFEEKGKDDIPTDEELLLFSMTYPFWVPTIYSKGGERREKILNSTLNK